MRILIHDFGGYPFTLELARELARAEHTVTYLSAGNFNTPRRRSVSSQGAPRDLEVRSVDIGDRFESRAGLRRIRHERRYGRRLADTIRSVEPQVVLSANTPLGAQALALRAAHRTGAGFVFWLQDLYSEAVRRLLGKRFPLAGAIIGQRYARLESTLLSQSEAVVPITPDFLPVLRSWGILEDRTMVIPNWAPLEEVRPLPKRNGWSERLGIADKRVLMYAGTLGRKHDPGLLVRLADELPDVTVVIVAGGLGVDQVRSAAESRGNVVVLPLQPAESLPEMLASADALVVILEPEAGRFSVPSKVLTYLTAGRPILASLPPGNEAGNVIRAAGAGIVVDAGDMDGFVAGARRLLTEQRLRTTAAAAGRAYAERHFDIKSTASIFEKIFEEALPAGNVLANAKALSR